MNEAAPSQPALVASKLVDLREGMDGLAIEARHSLRAEVVRRIGFRRAKGAAGKPLDHNVGHLKPAHVAAEPAYGRHRHAMTLEDLQEGNLTEHVGVAALPHSLWGQAHHQRLSTWLARFLVIDVKTKAQASMARHDFNLVDYGALPVMGNGKSLQLLLEYR